MDSGIAVALGAALLVAGWLWWSRSRVDASAESDLRRICSGDRGQVDRLIAGEMRRGPGPITRAEAARRAVERYRRDNR